MADIYEQAVAIAQTASVTTPEDGVILYSISFLPTKENKDKAFAYLHNHPQTMMIDQTECGKKLIELGLLETHPDLSQEQIASIWKIASARMIATAKGDIHAFVEGADPRSVFRSTELPALLQNPNVKTINGIDKVLFSRQNFGASF